MPYYRWDDILNRPLGDLQLGGQIARGAKDLGCQIWDNYASHFYAITPAPFFGNFAIRQFWNTLCYDPPENPKVPPPPAFTGGQCPIRYNLVGDVDVFPSSVNCDRSPSSVTTLGGNYWGPIISVFLDEPTGTCGGSKFVKIECHGLGANARLSSPAVFNVTSSSYGRFLELNDITFVASHGGVDDCGDPPSDYPEDNPPPNPGDVFIDIDLEGDPTNNFSPRIIWNDIDFSVPLRFDFEVGDIILDIGGIEVNFNDGNEWRLDDRNPPPPPPPDLYDPPGDLDEEESPDDQEEAEESNNPAIKYVVIDITTTPLFGRQNTILQPDPGDSTFFAGYFCWTYNGHRFPEKPIRKMSNIYYNDVGADGFRYYRINGAGLKHTIYSTPEE